jgi:glycosyltransferase involved in cell wall biosynthesis
VAASREAPKRIAIVTSGLGAGGAEQVIAQLASHWIASGQIVSIITFDRPGDLVFHKLPANAVLYRLGFANVIRRVVALRRVLRQHRPDLVLSFLTKINLIAALACIGVPVRLICCERNHPDRQHVHPLWNVALRIAYRRADVIVCQTEAVKRCFVPSLQDRLVTIPNPVPQAAGSRGKDGATRICAVGRLTHQKGFDVLVGAFAAIAARHPRWTLDIWGQGPDQAALEAQIATLGLQDRVVMRGLSARPRAWVEEAEVFVLSSRYEGFPNALGEAMAAGMPVVAAACEFGPADMIEDGVSGLLVPGEDRAALAAALERLIVDPALRARLGRAAREAMNAYRADHVLRLWDTLLAPTRVAERARSCPAPSRTVRGGW